MESIEKLREYAENSTCNGWRGFKNILKIADEIEREITERCMLLPVDAEGVPIRVGSKVVCSDGVIHTVMAVTDDGACLDTIEHYGRLKLHVAKPRTIEDVLEDFGIECDEQYPTGSRKELIVKYADELRGMGVGE